MTIDELRLEALQLAMSEANRSGGSTKEIVERAAIYFEFLTKGATDKP